MNIDKTARSNLCVLVEQKLDAFKNFLSVTMSLKEICVTNNMDHVERFLEIRDHYINMIDRIDRQIDIVTRDTSPIASTLPYEVKEIIGITAKAIAKTAEKAGMLNKEIEETLMIHHNKLKKQLLTTNNARTGIKGYILNDHGKKQPRFLDTKL
ncbi:MAG: hypothetical protein KJN62_08210 [Deltaproteobacteria bacterium]|nr:hypothetical protein [Deltaproteobacteria bacterium]